MKCYLKKLSRNMTEKEIEMYNEIPEVENGCTNEFRTCDSFDEGLEKRLNEEFVLLDDDNTPRITYIMFDDDYPIGEVLIRPVLNFAWYKKSGNVAYKIRPSKRMKGYGNEILRLGLEECKNLGLSQVRLCIFKYNVASQKIIEKNGGVLTEEDSFVKYYNIDLR